MNTKYNTMLYPFDIQSVSLIRHRSLINRLNINKFVSPNGWGLTGKDAGLSDNGQLTGITIDNDFDAALNECDTVFFNEPARKIDLEKLIYPKMIKAAESSKNIICSIQIDHEMVEKISNICSKNNAHFKYFSASCEKAGHPIVEKIYTINTPIILVAGTSERANKFEVQLNLREKLQNMGYKVSQIGTRHYCEVMGFHSFPSFMYSNSVTESEKVSLFNYYVKNIERRESPDVIIIGVPGGIMPFNQQFTNKYGILAYEISQAVVPDTVVLSTLYENYKPGFFDSISKSCRYKFGYEIDCFNITNSSLDITSSELERSPQYITIDWNFINQKIKETTDTIIPIYNVLDTDNSQEMADLLIDKLCEYKDTQSM